MFSQSPGSWTRHTTLSAARRSASEHVSELFRGGALRAFRGFLGGFEVVLGGLREFEGVWGGFGGVLRGLGGV